MNKMQPNKNNFKREPDQGSHEIMIFKTDASAKMDLNLLAAVLDNIPNIQKWNFDFNDCDNIFRVEANKISKKEIIKLLQLHCIRAEELID